MKKGEIARLTCKSDYAYGDVGNPPKIPSNATLIFEVSRNLFIYDYFFKTNDECFDICCIYVTYVYMKLIYSYIIDI